MIAVAVANLVLPSGPIYIVSEGHVSPSLIGWALVIGPLMGLASICYVRGIVWAHNNVYTRWKKFVFCIIIFLAIGIVSMVCPELLGNGQDVVQETFSNNLNISLVFLLLILRPVATMLCLSTGAPGGLFTPTMTFGALLGSLLGHIWERILPSGHNCKLCHYRIRSVSRRRDIRTDFFACSHT